MYKFIFVILCTFNCSVANANLTPEKIRISIESSGGVEIFLRKIAALASKNLPQMKDAETEIFSVSTLNKAIHFNNRSVIHEKSQINNLQLLKKSMPIISANLLCSSPVAKILINESNVKYSYSYYSKGYEFLFKYTIDKSQCNKI